MKNTAAAHIFNRRILAQLVVPHCLYHLVLSHYITFCHLLSIIKLTSVLFFLLFRSSHDISPL